MKNIAVTKDERGRVKTLTFENKDTVVIKSLCEDGTEYENYFIESINGEKMNSANIVNPVLFEVEEYFHCHNTQYLGFLCNDKKHCFPVLECVELLPEIIGPLKFELELDRYDGPISGIVSNEHDYYYFSWVMDSFNSKNYGSSSPRRFYTRKVAKSSSPQIGQWLQRSQEIDLELNFRSRARSGLRPVPKSQMLSWLPSDEELSAESSALIEKIEGKFQSRITGWFEEFDSNFAGIRTFEMSKEDWSSLNNWEVSVGLSLLARDQVELNKVFKAKPLYHANTDIFWVNQGSDNATSVDNPYVACNKLGEILTPEHPFRATESYSEMRTRSLEDSNPQHGI